jgi:hypothetical protein
LIELKTSFPEKDWALQYPPDTRNDLVSWWHVDRAVVYDLGRKDGGCDRNGVCGKADEAWFLPPT